MTGVAGSFRFASRWLGVCGLQPWAPGIELRFDTDLVDEWPNFG